MPQSTVRASPAPSARSARWGIDNRPKDLVQFTATKAKAGVTGRRRSLRWWRGEILAIYFYGVDQQIIMKETDISVFVDESGSFDSDDGSSRFYLICLVVHDQREDIEGDVAALEDSLASLGLGRGHCIHAGPLIRREGEYAGRRASEPF